MKSVKLPDEMVEAIKAHIIKEKRFGYESITEFVRGAVRDQLLEQRQRRDVTQISEAL